MTVRRTIVILILLTIVFFIYRGISPKGADALLLQIRNIPVRLGILSGEMLFAPGIDSGSMISGSVTTGSLTTGDLFSGEVVSSGEALAFSSTLVSGGLFDLQALVIPVENTTPIVESSATGGHLVIVDIPPQVQELTGNPQSVIIKKPQTTPIVIKKSVSSSSRNLSQDTALLNDLFK